MQNSRVLFYKTIFLIFLFKNSWKTLGQTLKCHHDLDWGKLKDETWLENFDTAAKDSGFDISTDEPDPPDKKLGSHLLIPPPPPTNFPPWVSVPVEQHHLTLFKQVFKLMIEKGLFFNCRHGRPENPFLFKTPTELKSLFDFSLGDKGVSHAELLKLLETLIKYSPHNSHPFIMARRAAGLDPAGLVGDWIASVTSGVSGSYMLAPGHTLMEIEIVRKIRQLVGYPNPMLEFGGIFVPGAGSAVQFALQIALQSKIPGIKEKGIFGQGNGALKPCFFMSEAASNSAEKGALLQGIGTQAIWKIKIDARGRMDLVELRKKIQEAKSTGWTPFLVYATAGTPRLGAIDPINGIADICAEFGLWLHIDGNSGGIILSKVHRPRLAGIERSDSFSWSMVQTLAVPFTTTIIVTKERVLDKTIGIGDMPVFGVPPFYNASYDIGDTTLQTARRADVLKIWFIWKAKGKKGLNSHIMYNFANVDFATKVIKSRPSKFRLLLPEFDLCLVSFVLLHPSVAQLDWFSPEFKAKNDEFTTSVHKRLRSEVLRLSLSTLGNYPKFLTIFFNNNVLTKQDIIYIFDQIEYYASKVSFGADGKLIYGETNRSAIEIPKPSPKFPHFVSSPISSMHASFFVHVFKAFLSKALFAEDRRSSPMEFFDGPTFEKSFDLSLGNDPTPYNQLLKIIKDIIRFNSFQADPYYMYQLVSGRDAYSMIADFFIGMLNPPMVGYDDHPIFITMDNVILKEVRKIIGYKEGDGVPTAGANFAVQIAIALARHKKFPEAKQFGNNFAKKKMVIYTSRRTKRAYIKAAFYAGIGTTKCVIIDTSSVAFNGRMLMDQLRNEINKTLAEGDIPLMVSASIGTSIFGAIDSLDEIADICEKHQIWLHVDGSFGGSVIMSKREFHRVKGIERSDSFHVNAHRLLGAVAFSTAFVTRHNDLMLDAFKLISTVDFSIDTFLKGENDLGDKNVEMTRRADLFKFWLMFKAKGRDGLGAHIDRLYDLTAYMTQEMIKHPRFEPYQAHWDTTNICFLYVPDRLRDLYKKGKDTPEFISKISNVTDALQAKLAREGVTFCQVSTVCPTCPRFFRWAITHSSLTNEDLVHLIKQTDELGKNL